jgi:hypothetical protein
MNDCFYLATRNVHHATSHTINSKNQVVDFNNLPLDIKALLD